MMALDVDLNDCTPGSQWAYVEAMKTAVLPGIRELLLAQWNAFFDVAARHDTEYGRNDSGKEDHDLILGDRAEANLHDLFREAVARGRKMRAREPTSPPREDL
jgi:hypothetical protein